LIVNDLHRLILRSLSSKKIRKKNKNKTSFPLTFVSACGIVTYAYFI